MEENTKNNKRKLPDLSFDNVNWRQLFLKYDEDKNGTIDLKEFTFLVKDLISLRDSNDHASLEDAVFISKSILQHESIQKVEEEASELAINLDMLRSAACEGAFDDEQILPEFFMVLSGDDDAIPPSLQQRASSDVVKQELKLRPIVQSLLRNGNTKLNELVEGDLCHCAVCYDKFDLRVMYGGCTIPKTCSCKILLCLSCLAGSARSQIMEGRRPTCPHMSSSVPPRRCTVSIDQSLLAQLFKNTCPLCELAPTECNPLLSVGCLHDVHHTFCVQCLHSRVQLNLKNNTEITCPRYAECRGELNEAALRTILNKYRSSSLKNDKSKSEGGFADQKNLPSKLEKGDRNNNSYGIELLIEQWYKQRLHRLQLSYSGGKPCSSPGCLGVLIASVSLRKSSKKRFSNISVYCELCKKSMCWSCGAPSHPSFSCFQLVQFKNDWIKFLQKLVGEGGENSSASKVLLKYEQSALDTLYFKRNVADGILKKCPKCSRLIEKLQGCDAMVCGQNADGGNLQSGCGHHFSWSSVSNLNVDSVTDIDNSKEKVSFGDDLDLHLTTDHFDISDPCNPRVVNCQKCSAVISGTRFSCVNCHSSANSVSNSFCLSCVRKEIGASEGEVASVHSSNNMAFASVFPSSFGSDNNNSSVNTGLHRDHTFRLISPPNVNSCIVAAARLSISRLGSVEVNSLKQECYRSASTRAQHPGGAFSFSHTERRSDSHPTLVMVDLHPDGKLVFADNHCQGLDWLSLDSILFPCDFEDKKSIDTFPLSSRKFEEKSGDHCGTLNVSIGQDSQFYLFHGGHYPIRKTIKEGQQMDGNTLPSFENEEFIRLPDISGSYTADRLAVISEREKEFSLIVPPSIVKSFNSADISQWNPLTQSPNEYYSVSGEYLVHGNMCHLAGHVVKDLERCSLKTRTTCASDIQRGDLITVLPINIRPKGAHDVIVFMDEMEQDSEASFKERALGVLRLLGDGRVYFLDFIGKGVLCPLRIFLDGIHFPTSREGEDHSLDLIAASNVQFSPTTVTEHSKIQPNVYCGRKRTVPCSCGNCAIGTLCGPDHGCSCHRCLQLEIDLNSDMLGDNSAANTFAMKCHKVIEQVKDNTLTSSGGTLFGGFQGDSMNQSRKKLNFGKVAVHMSPDNIYCCFSGQVFKQPKTHTVKPTQFSPSGPGSLPVSNARREIFESDEDEDEDDEYIGGYAERNPFNSAVDNCWTPGDLICTLPLDVKRPGRLISFAVIAGKGALGNKN